MCAINPKHQQRYVLSVYTSIDMPREEFSNLVTKKILQIEFDLNEDMRLRWHIEESHSDE